MFCDGIVSSDPIIAKYIFHISGVTKPIDFKMLFVINLSYALI